MAKEVSLEQLHDWLKKNLQRTWAWGKGLDGEKTLFDTPRPHTLEIKYLNFRLDTRDGKIFHIQTDEHHVDFRDDDKDWTILDLLESKLQKLK